MEDVNIAASEFNLFIRTQIDRERGTHIRGNKEYHTFAIYIIKYLMFDGEMSNVSSWCNEFIFKTIIQWMFTGWQSENNDDCSFVDSRKIIPNENNSVPI